MKTTVQLDPELGTKLIAAARNPRDRALVALLSRTGIRISEAVQLKEENIDFTRGSLTIAHLKERVKLKCPTCGETLGKRHNFCPGCGSKIDEATKEKVNQRRERVIPIDRDTLRLLDEYLKWRRKFPYDGPLVFPITRQRGWQLMERLGRRAGVKGLHPHSLRHLLATTWVNKGLDTRKLQLLLGHATIATTMEYVDSNLEQIRCECNKLWAIAEDEGNEPVQKGNRDESK
ncbi:MAG: tyrosine-type recombinase/integrase [Dehalococcoidia bacterium]